MQKSDNSRPDPQEERPDPQDKIQDKTQEQLVALGGQTLI